MNYNISKELFEVINEYKVDEIKVVDDYIQIYKDTAMIRVSIYEFFFKCKEWAYMQRGLTILSGTYKNTVKGFLQNKEYIGYAAIQYYVIDEYRTGTYCLKTDDKI